MKTKQIRLGGFGPLLVTACLFASFTAWAQPGGGVGGFGGFGGFNNTQQRNTSSSGTRASYPSSTDVGQARITYDSETRSLIVVADDDTALHIKDVVNQLDRPAPQVLIKCVFLEATYSRDSDIGVDGMYKHKISGAKIGALNTPAGQMNAASTAFDLATSGGMYTLLGKDLEVTIAALAKAGKTEILSRPSILARNNQQATITIGQQVPLISGVTYDSFGNQRNAITYQNVGIILQVTPFITSDGMVEMIATPQISSVSDSSVNFATGGTNGTPTSSAPIINIRSADTVVVVPNGQTVVIGGLMQSQKVSSESKVPILGDIPLLGMLFKHKLSSNGKTELLIFMTPYIVKDPRDLAAVSDSEKSRVQTTTKAFSEQELNHFLDKVPEDPSSSTEYRYLDVPPGKQPSVPPNPTPQ